MYHYRHRRRHVIELLLLLRIFPKLFVCVFMVYEGAQTVMQLVIPHTRIEVVQKRLNQVRSFFFFAKVQISKINLTFKNEAIFKSSILFTYLIISLRTSAHTFYAILFVQR